MFYPHYSKVFDNVKFSIGPFANIDLAEIKDKTFKVNKPKEEIFVQWDYDKIKRAIVILVENAFKYTGENGEISLNIEDMNKYVKVTVKDNFPSIR